MYLVWSKSIEGCWFSNVHKNVTEGRTDGRKDRRTDGRKDRRTDGRTGGSVTISLRPCLSRFCVSSWTLPLIPGIVYRWCQWTIFDSVIIYTWHTKVYFLPWPSIEIDIWERFKIKLYDNVMISLFRIVNFPIISSNIPGAPPYGVYISQLLRYSSACAQCSNFWTMSSCWHRIYLNKGEGI
jgi:hypothetical protein